MTDNSNTSDKIESEVDDILQKKDFGVSFKAAREKSSLSIADVAEQLLISADIIKALENSQADALPALTFTQGYIRSYAKLLDIPADPIIDDYVKVAPNSKQVLVPNSVLPSQSCCSDKVITLISISFFVMAIIVLAYWVITTDFKDNNVDLLKSDEEKRVKIENVKVGSIKKTPIQKTINIATASDDIESIETEKNIAQAKQVNTPTSTEKAGALQINDTLILNALDDSWCEIQDSTGKRLYYQLLNRGEEIELNGVAPFMVFLGNAPKIRLEINNKIVDFESLISKSSNIANLKVEKDAAVTSQ